MKKIILLAFVLMPLAMQAQYPQKGHVRKQTFDGVTVGAPVAGVQIVPYKGNQIKTDGRGNFVATFAGKKANDTATLKQVKKEGYYLTSTNLLRKGGLTLSAAPVDIIIGSEAERKADAAKSSSATINSYKRGLDARDKVIQQKQEEIEKLYENGKADSADMKAKTEELVRLRQEVNSLKSKFYSPEYRDEVLKTADSLSRIDIQSLDSIKKKSILLQKEGRYEELVAYNKPVGVERVYY